MIDIKSIQGDVIISVPITKECVIREELMSADYISLSWLFDSYIALPAGAYIEYNGERYSLLKPYSPTMKDEASFEYKPQFQSRIMRWQKIIVPVYTFDSQGEVKTREFDWSFTGSPIDLMSMVNRAILNETGEVWNFSIADDLPETVNITAQSSSVWSLLSDLADQCKTEWWVDKAANWLYLSKCSHGVNIPLEVGKEVGVPSVTQNNTDYFTRFYAFGSDRNMTQEDGVVQGSVINRRLTLDPKKYPHGYKDIKGHFENGVFVSDLLPEEVLVTSLYFEDVYPSSNLSISRVRKRMKYRLDEDGNKIIIGGTGSTPIYEQYAIWYFQLPAFAFSEDLIIEGLTLSVAFKSGKLQGREFELAYHAKDKKVADIADVDVDFSVKAGEYEIIFDESGSMIIPDDDYIIPENGDEVTLFNINLPSEYKDSARFELEAQLDKAIEERTTDNNTYEFSSNPIAFSKKGIALTLGQRVAFTSGSTELSTRVMMIEKRLDFECQQKIRIGNVKISGSRQQLKDEVREVGEEVSEMNKYTSFLGEAQRNHSRELMISMGRYFAMRDTIDMLQNAIEGYTEGISPITVETMALMVGDESLQFRFTVSRSNLQAIPCPLVYNSNTKQLNASACSIVHMTLDVNEVTAQSIRNASEYHSWDMGEWHSSILEDATKKYYVYAKVEKEGYVGTYVLSETAIGMKDDADFYHLLIGILNAEYAQVRELVTLYGFTEVRPGQISTDTIQDSNKNLVIDLVNATITAKDGARIQGDITFGSATDGLSNLGEWKSFKDDYDSTIEEVREIASTADAATKTLDTKITNVETGMTESVNEINARLDGVVENYFEKGVPTTSNYPANEWTTDAEKANHVGDTYTNISSYDEDPNNAGKSWRWTFTDSKHTGYHWHPIADSDAVKALLEASKAKTAADGKARNFVTQPKPPYSVGDTWMQGSSGDIMRCKVARETGSYTASDWEIAAKYTDDTKANEAQATANKAKEAADDAAIAASNASEAAANATAQAQAANTKLSNWASDSNISILELQGIKDEHAFVVADKNDILAQAAKYSLSVLLFELSCDSYIDKLSQIINAFDAATIKPDYVSIPFGLQDAQDSYYEARTTILDKIATTAKKVADDAKSVADDAAETAQAAKDAIDAFKEEVADDYGYLHDTFGQVTSGQVFLGKLMGVGTGVDASINAYMDGSGLVSNTTDGKLMLAMGIPTGSGTLASRAAEATTRIYEKGKIVSKEANISGLLSATQGNIGLQYFNSEYYVSFKSKSGHTNVVQEGGGLTVVSRYNPNNDSKQLRFGVGGLLNLGGSWQVLDKDGNFSYSTYDNAYTTGGVLIEQSGISDAALVIKKIDNTDSDAIDCKQGHIRVRQGNIISPKGLIKGLRPNTRDVSSGETLTEYDYNVFCSSGTIYLPKSPILGQTYDIFHTSTTSITINGNGNNIYCLDGSNGLKSGTSHSTSQARRLHLVWGGANWYLDSNMW